MIIKLDIEKYEKALLNIKKNFKNIHVPFKNYMKEL